MSDTPHETVSNKAADGEPEMIGLRPGWNDEGYFFHPDAIKSDRDTIPEQFPSKSYLMDLAIQAAESGLIPPNDLDTKLSVISGFKFYESFGLREVARVEKAFKALPKFDADLLPFDVDTYIKNLKMTLRTNQILLDQVSDEFCEALSDSLYLRAIKHADPSADKKQVYQDCLVEVESRFADMIYEMTQDKFLVAMSSARSTVKQFVRDWSDIGQVERDQSYEPLLEALTKYIPNPRHEDGKLKRVLCPGSGLGRLPFEVLCRGYASQGNEYAHSMLIASDWVLNHSIQKLSIKIYPYALQGNNRRRREQVFNRASLPDVSPAEVFPDLVQRLFPDFNEYPDGFVFSMSEGEFVEAYDGDVDSWDCLLASFFLDTAQNIIQYLKTIARILKPGAYFMSNGPLLYHYAESDNKPSIEIAFEDLRQIISKWFDIVEEREIDASYTANGESLMRTAYTTKFIVCRRNDTENPPMCEPTIFNPAHDESCHDHAQCEAACK